MSEEWMSSVGETKEQISQESVFYAIIDVKLDQSEASGGQRFTIKENMVNM